MAYDANIVKDLSTTTPTEGSSYIPEMNDAVREVKRVIVYNESVTAVSSYPYTVLTTDSTLYCTGAGGTVAGPQLSTVSTTAFRKELTVINDSSSTVTFDPYSTETVGGASTYAIAAGAIAKFLAHGGTDWEIISIPASATAAANTVVISDSAGRVDWNRPCFEATMSADQTFVDNTPIKITFNTETFDTHSNYDHATNYRFTPTVAGKYLINIAVRASADIAFQNTHSMLYLYKNANIFRGVILAQADTGMDEFAGMLSVIVDANGTTDYFESYLNGDVSSGTGGTIRRYHNDASGAPSFFSACRIGV